MTHVEHVSTSLAVVHINGREYMLYDEYVGRLKFADVKRLWIAAAMSWATAAILAMGAGMRAGLRPPSGLVIPFILLAVAVLVASLVLVTMAVVALASGPTFLAPVAAIEVDRTGPWSTLSVTTRRRRVLAVVARTEMADFLLSEFAPGRGRSHRRTGAPAALTYPTMKRYVWAAYAALFVSVSVGVATVIQAIGSFAGDLNS